MIPVFPPKPPLSQALGPLRYGGSGRLRQMMAALALTALAAPVLASPSSPATPPPSACKPEQQLHWRGGSFRFENDLIAGTDRNYTNGVALTLVSHDIPGRLQPQCLPRLLGLYAGLLGRLNPGFWDRAGGEAVAQNVVLRVGQAMYTPENRSRTDLIVDDRPYAGLLYVGMAWNRRAHPQGARHEKLDTRELTLGIIGPASLARQSQNLIHDLRGIDRFRGWDNQLRGEPAFQFVLERKLKPYVEGAIRPGWSSDAIAAYGLRLGNIETAASAGLELRAGWNIPNDFGSYPIRPGAENRPPSATVAPRGAQQPATAAPRAGVHAFANLEVKAVAWDFSLDGNLFRSSHSVRRQPWVAQAAVGLSAQWPLANHRLRLALMRVWRTREFAGQHGHHAFGSISLSMDF